MHAADSCQFFVHVVWLIGQYAAQSSDPRCTAQFLIEFHEARVSVRLWWLMGDRCWTA